MKLEDLIDQKAEWLKGEGPKAEIVVSTRIRLARNIKGHFFPGWANDKQRDTALEKSISGLKRTVSFKNALFLRMREMDMMDREFLVERHLMSREHAVDVKSKAVVVDEKEAISIMLNEEDHLRIQVLRSGFNIMDAWGAIDKIDQEISRYLQYSYSPKFGYLTSCPTNTGTGMRASVMLHLVALAMTDQMSNVYDAISKLGMTIRGFYGEGTEALGNFYQISNQVTLGHSELDILDNLVRVVNKLIEREEATRTHLLKNKKQEITDSVCRSYGTLRSARIITSDETIRLMSAVRLGVELGLIKDHGRGEVNDLFLLTQPSHLQKIEKKTLTPHERDIKRADLIREKLGERAE